MKLIERTFYLDKLKDVMKAADIKVITGVRRSGKSKLLEAFMEYVRQADTAANIIHVNYSLSEYEPLLEYHKLNAYVEKAYQAEKTNYIFIDEVQMCEGFEKAINNFHLGSPFLNRFSLYQEYYFLTIHQLIGSAFLNPYQLFSSGLLSFNHSSLLSLELFHLLHKKFRFFSIRNEIYTH